MTARLPPKFHPIKEGGRHIGDVLAMRIERGDMWIAYLPFGTPHKIGGQKSHKAFATRRAAEEWLRRKDRELRG